MRVAVLFSGGKDSVFATFWAMFQGFDPVLVSVIPPDYSMMFHHPNVSLTKDQARVMGLEHHFVDATDENWREQLVQKFKELNVKGIVTGAIASEYQKRRIDSIGNELEIPTYCPLWHRDEPLLKELDGFDVIVTAVSADGLDESYLGAPLRKITESSIPGIHPLLEGGEGETFVLDCPIFRKKLVVKKIEKEFDGVRGVARLHLEA